MPERPTTLARWQQVQDLLDAGVGLLECARRLNMALNTVKRFPWVDNPEQMRRALNTVPRLSIERLDVGDVGGRDAYDQRQHLGVGQDVKFAAPLGGFVQEQAR
jgi:hypothetical protein